MAGDGELRFAEGEYSLIGYVSNLHELLRAIDEAMPTDATLYMEGDSIVPEIRDYLASRRSPAPRNIWRGSTGRKQKIFHIPLAETNLAELRELAEHHAAPEICDHLVVYRDDQILLAAYDAGDNFVEVSRSLLEETVAQLRVALGGALTERKPPSLIGRLLARRQTRRARRSGE
jgi:hypothetical protein